MAGPLVVAGAAIETFAERDGAVAAFAGLVSSLRGDSAAVRGWKETMLAATRPDVAGSVGIAAMSEVSGSATAGFVGAVGAVGAAAIMDGVAVDGAAIGVVGGIVVDAAGTAGALGVAPAAT